ncbi:hypothetical protein IH992_29485, partial [Candidatus Poribacteria bacterium]|nr:hypothetical protein [Candidatus Poribacteria bacterium]
MFRRNTTIHFNPLMTKLIPVLAACVLMFSAIALASLIDAVLGGHIVQYSGSTVVFTSAGGGGGGTIEFTADDTKMNYDGGGVDAFTDQLGNNVFAVEFTLTVTVDSTGTVTGGTMTERVKSNAQLKLINAPGGPFTYLSSEVLLTGGVTGFELETGSGVRKFGASININAAGSKWASGATSIGWVTTTFDTVVRGDFQLQSGTISTEWWNGGNFSGNTLEGKKGVVPSTLLPGEIGDTVFCDTNDNGSQDAGEPGINDVKVTLTCGNNPPID